MKISGGVNPNCSELIVRLPDWANLDELKLMLRDVERASGWRVGYVSVGSIPITTFAREVSPEKAIVYRLASSDSDFVRYFVAVPLTVEHIKLDNRMRFVFPLSAFPKRYHFFVRNSLFADTDTGAVTMPVMLVAYKRPIVKVNYNTDPIDGIWVSKHSFCEIDATTLTSGYHGYTPHFKPLAKVIRALDLNWYTHDGGDPKNFKQWCSRKFKDVAEKCLSV